MSGKDSIANQLGWCNSTRSRIEEFEQTIISVANGYDAITNELRNTTVFGEFLSKVEQRQEAFRGETKQLLAQLQQDNLNYVNKQSDRLQKELGEL
ncbi:MAG: hypothetical protein CSB47_00195 [Proteobacteria bacterium]|nr:MAG: hypothetical protein CSB47_00195 [Pseudomonadota bacterium]